MKTKTMALSLMMTFASCALFAQANTDTIPKDSIPKTDTTTQKKDTMPSASATFEIRQKTNFINFLKNNPADDQIMKNKNVSSFILTKENGRI